MVNISHEMLNNRPGFEFHFSVMFISCVDPYKYLVVDRISVFEALWSDILYGICWDRYTMVTPEVAINETPLS